MHDSSLDERGGVVLVHYICRISVTPDDDRTVPYLFFFLVEKGSEFMCCRSTNVNGGLQMYRRQPMVMCWLCTFMTSSYPQTRDSVRNVMPLFDSFTSSGSAYVHKTAVDPYGSSCSPSPGSCVECRVTTNEQRFMASKQPACKLRTLCHCSSTPHNRIRCRC
jgi:hypothetical protein